MAADLFEVFHDAGRQGRILVADSLTHFTTGTMADDIVLGASFAGVATAAVPLAHGIKGWIGHEVGPGKDSAGGAEGRSSGPGDACRAAGPSCGPQCASR